MSLASPSRESPHHDAESGEEEAADGIVGDEPLEFKEELATAIAETLVQPLESPALAVGEDAADVD